MRRFTALVLLPLLGGCPDYEGPIDVILDGIEAEEATIEWATAGSDDFQACDGGPTDPEAVVGCGPYGVGEPGTYTVRVTWLDLAVDKDATIETDGDYQANTSLTFSAEDFGVEAEDTGT